MLAERLLHDGLHWPSFSAAQAEESARWVFARVRQGWCAMRGHDLMLHLEPCRLSLRCADCGWESPGWTIETSRRCSQTAPAARGWQRLLQYRSRQAGLTRRFSLGLGSNDAEDARPFLLHPIGRG